VHAGILPSNVGQSASTVESTVLRVRHKKIRGSQAGANLFVPYT